MKMKEMVGGCCVCSDERGWAENPLVYCDGQGCNVAVHQACYGIITVPSGPWYCRKCESQERAARVRCEMCPQKDGALKRTDTGGWCHVVCALFIPEAWFGNVQTMEPIILKGVPPERFNKQSCYICEESNRQSKSTTGGCMQCNKVGCKANFHVTCAQQLGLLCEEAGNYDNVKYCGYCSYHFKKLKKDRFIKAIPAFKPIQGELIAYKGESPEKIYQFSDETSEVFDIKAQREKKKDSTVKQIPPFKPLASADATPENTPEKSNPFRDGKLKEKRAPSSQESSIASPGTSSSSDITSSGKFTTANFREASITHSPANIFMIEQEKKLKNLQARKQEQALVEKKAQAKKLSEKDTTAPAKKIEKSQEKVDKVEKQEKLKADTGPTEKSTKSESKKGEGMKQEPTSTGATADIKSPTLSAGGDGKTEQRKSSSSKFAELASAPLFAMTTPSSAGGGVAKDITSPVAVTTSTTATTSVSQSTFSYSYESFLNKNFATSAKEEVSSPESASRKRTKAQDSAEKKPKVKKQKVEKATNKTKTVKDLLTSPGQSSPPASPTPENSPPHKDGSADKVKTKPSRKRKDSSTSTAASQASSSAYSGAPYARNTTLPITLSSLQKHVEKTGGSNADVPTLSPQVSPTSSAPKLLPMDHSPTKESIADSFMNGSLKGLVSPPKPLSIKTNLASPKSSSEVPIGPSMPTSMEQLLERQWDQGSAFLMEQGQHFDIASLLNCLHQLRQENQRLEEHIQNLSARRDHLLAVNARLALSHTPINNTTPGQTNTPGQGASPEAGGRAVRINNLLPPTLDAQPQESGGSSRVSRSPGQAAAPTQNHVSHNNTSPGSKSSGPGGSNTTQQSPNDTHNATTTSGTSDTTRALTSHNVTAASMAAGGGRSLEEQQRPVMMQQNVLISPEQQQQMMFHLFQQQAAYSALSQGAAAAVGGGTHPPHVSSAPPPPSRSHLTVNHSGPGVKADKNKDKT